MQKDGSGQKKLQTKNSGYLTKRKDLYSPKVTYRKTSNNVEGEKKEKSFAPQIPINAWGYLSQMY